MIALLQTSATSAPLHPQKSNFFSSPLSLCFTSPSLLHVCLSPSVSVSVSGAPLSLPYPLLQPLTPYFSHTSKLMISLSDASSAPSFLSLHLQPFSISPSLGDTLGFIPFAALRSLTVTASTLSKIHSLPSLITLYLSFSTKKTHLLNHTKVKVMD